MRLWTCLIAALWLAMPGAATARDFYFGADLSFANEMEDCGAKFTDDGQAADPFAIFRAHGANLVRVRIWNDPDWTHYSNLADVKKTIARARAQGLQVLLDFHYSDDWADGDKQLVPKAWAGLHDPEALVKALHDYTYDTLISLDRDGLMPDMVQVGNETNAPMLGGKKGEPIAWARNARLLNAGITAVREAGAKSAIKPRVMLHIAQPENVELWFQAAYAAGVTDFDVIGMSYYAKWSTQSFRGLGGVINRLRHRYGVDVVVVETAYPWTLDNADTSPDVLGQDSVVPGYPASPEGQARYLGDLTQAVISSGGVGVVYWAPDWVSTRCKTRWGEGSSWDNATFFDFRHQLLPAIDFMKRPYDQLVDVTFKVKDAAVAKDRPLYLWGDFLGARDFVVHLQPDGQGAWTYATRLAPGQTVRFQVYDQLPLTAGLLKADGGYSKDVVGATGTVIERTAP
ncbi:MAG TPA: arabinogalactan endo-1,4-beta-galactosidase [Caulobacteraceae bacterium]|jgi:arabinogalactan endo-1,4-beta-galactosidase